MLPTYAVPLHVGIQSRPLEVIMCGSNGAGSIVTTALCGSHYGALWSLRRSVVVTTALCGMLTTVVTTALVPFIARLLGLWKISVGVHTLLITAPLVLFTDSKTGYYWWTVHKQHYPL